MITVASESEARQKDEATGASKAAPGLCLPHLLLMVTRAGEQGDRIVRRWPQDSHFSLSASGLFTHSLTPFGHLPGTEHSAGTTQKGKPARFCPSPQRWGGRRESRGGGGHGQYAEITQTIMQFSSLP